MSTKSIVRVEENPVPVVIPTGLEAEDVNQHHVLVIDDETEMLRLFRVCLSANGYQVTTARDCEAGLELAALEPPGVIILDLVMPDMSGLEVCRRLRANPKTARIPILAVSGEDPVEDQSLASRREFDDFITKPFRHDELLARVDALIRHPSKTRKGPDEFRRLQILRAALRGGPDALVPRYSSQTLSGFAYAATNDIQEEGDQRDFVGDLEALHDQGYLERSFHDTVLVCASCAHHDVHFREVCVSCASSDLEMVEMVHHYRCAYVGPTEEFRKDRDLVCPKCHGLLRHVGIDYQKPADAVRCRQCSRLFQDPDVVARCRNCNQAFPAENAIRKRIYRYAVTSAGQNAAGGNTAQVGPGDRERAHEVAQDYRMKFLRELVDEEVARCTAAGEPTALLKVGVQGLDQVLAERGQASAKQVLQSLLRTLRGATRRVDKIGRIRPDEFILVIPGADRRSVLSVARRIAESFIQNRERELRKVALSYTWAVHPDEIEDARILLDYVLEEKPDAAPSDLGNIEGEEEGAAETD